MMKMKYLLAGMLLAAILVIGGAGQKAPTKKPSQVSTAGKKGCADMLTQHDMNRCAQEEYKKADAELNKFYLQAIAKLSPEHKPKLKTAQLAWIQFRDAHCDCEAFTFDGGSMEPLIKFSCLASVTKHRTQQIKSLADDAAR